ncbi:MAG: alpha/beta hydrolase [Pseudomonadota bacterium]|nr:alpha/beta hydrolase [Pseudomonadota bacterium]
MRVLLLLIFFFANAPALQAQLAAAVAKAHPLALGTHQTVVNDVRLWYRVAGRKRGIPVVYLHGGPGQGSQSFAAIAGPALERTQRMIYLDQRGSGRSEKPWTNAYSVALMVDDLEKLRQIWKVPQIALIGHSFGTVVALEYAKAYPKHTAALVLAAGVPDVPAAGEIQCDRLERTDPDQYRRSLEGMAAGAIPRCNPLKGRGQDGSERYISSLMFPDPATAELVRHWDKKDGLGNTGIVGRHLLNDKFMRYRFEARDALTMPVLVIAGGKDFQAVAEPQRQLASDVPNGRFLTYPDAGHFMWADAPERFATDLTEFLAKAVR